MGACELFRSRAAQLYVGEDNDSVLMLMQSGDFTLVLVKNVVSQLAAVLAMVGAVQWPVGKDCAVSRTGEARFSFSLPGPLSYTLVLGSSSSAEDLHKLEKILEEFSTCSSPRQHPGVVGEEHESLQQPSNEIPASISSGLSEEASTDKSSLQTMGILQRARRMSAIAKVFSRSLERGTISPSSHVKPLHAVAQDSRSTSLNVALAGVDAVAKVVEAVEMGGRTLLESSGSAVATEHGCIPESSAEQVHGVSGLICSGWTLNRHGLLTIYGMITASMAIHVGASSRSGSSRSSSTSSSELRRLLSSPSSSSLSSRSPGSSPALHVRSGADVRNADGRVGLPQPFLGTSMPSPAPPPLPPFMAYRPRGRVPDMPPPSGPLPASVSASLNSPSSSSFRVYNPRQTQAMASSSLPAPTPPPCPPRPPGFRAPRN